MEKIKLEKVQGNDNISIEDKLTALQNKFKK